MAAQKTSFSSSLAQEVAKHHDVFLSFRGEDTRNTFTSHLYCSLREKGVQVFIDNELIRGEEIATSLIQTIRQSKISIVVFSENYASSPWCLDELVNIMECRNSLGQLVWPIFFNVDPSHVRNQDVKGSFREALAKYEADSTEKYKEKLPKWKIALNKAANLSGWHLSNGNESQLIQRVVEAALRKLNRTALYVAKYPVGIENRLKDLGSLMNLEANDVRVIGIYGLGGIGKTTIAKAVFNKFADEFEGSSFLANVREMSKQHCGLVKLQETLLFDILGDENLKVGNIHRGINIIRERLRYKRVLIVLDDVDHLDQLETLVGAHEWFGSRSRIIITTRYKHFLTVHGANDTYEVGGLRHDQALELLRYNAFNGDKAVKVYHELSERVVGYANGIPLALNVLGSFLCDKDEDEWKSAIMNLERKPNKEIYAMLKISYDALQDNEKAIFLDIACFFVGEDKDYVSEILESCNFCTTIGIRVLIDMSLINIESGKVRMHNLIQEMGWEIVRQESAEIDKRSRLWLPNDVFHVFWEKMGTNAIEGIKLDLPQKETLELSARAFKNMKRLRLLIFDKVYLSTSIENLPTELRFINWPGYQFPTLPFSSGRKQLVILNMPRSCIKQLGEGFKNFENLKSVNLSYSEFLTKIPDLSTAPNVESLYVDHCTNLVEIHESIGSLIRLVTLDPQFCPKLRIFPSTLRANCLRKLNFKGCFSLARLPIVVVEMENLKVLCLSFTAIKKLPDLSKVPNLESLYLDHCINLVEVHESVGSLTGLQTLSLQFCFNLRILPRCLRSKCLGALNLTNCYSLEKFPDILLEMQNLCLLSLSGSAIKELPSSIEHLVSLRTLNLVSCRKLEHIPSSIYKLHQLQWLSIRDCSNLCKFPKNISSSTCNVTFPSSELLPVAFQLASNSSLNFPLPMLKLLDLQNCNLSNGDFLATPNGFHSLQHLYLGENMFINLPSIDRLPKLCYVNLNGCKFLREIPEIPRNLSYLYASDCESLLDAQGKIMAKIKRNKDSEIQVIYPRDYIPHWFSHKCEGDSVTFILPHSNEWKEISGVIICGVFEVDCKAVEFSLKLVGDTLPASQGVQFPHVSPTASLDRSIPSAKSGDMWLHYLPANTCPKLMTGKIYELSFSAMEKTSTKFISRCGVHVTRDEDDINSANSELFAGVRNLEGLDLRGSKHPKNVHILSHL